jgi:hypothetical protein
MRKGLLIRVLAVSTLAGSGGLAMFATGNAGAKGVKPPVTVTCTSVFGNATTQLESGCVGSAKSKVTSSGIIVPNASAGTAVISWTNRDVTDLTITNTLTPGPGSCSPYLGVAASDVITETSTVSGGTSKLTIGQSGTSQLCLYEAGGDILVTGTGSFTI